ncbi:MAG: molybdenum cofactor guanylyltransferase [Nitrospirae bacterium]|nr:molybdenum cofactor guanylyltransferase [Nitrospirota bacterium]
MQPLHGIGAALLAGGAGRRMGADKATLPFAGGTLGGNAARLLLTLFDDVMVVRRGDQPAPAWPPGVRVVTDPDDTPRSALTGIATALRHARRPWLFVMACDMPHPDPRLIGGLCRMALAAGPEVRLVVPEAGGVVHPLHAVYHRSLLAPLTAAIAQGDLRVQAFARQHGLAVAEARLRGWDPSLAGLDNLNTPDELDRARRQSGDRNTT